MDAYQHALAVLQRCLTHAGFVASPLAKENYARVWARDGVITGLAAIASGDATLIEGMERTLDTLTTHQGPHGEIPSNVTLDGRIVSYGHLVGRVDAVLWYVIGVCSYLHIKKHSSRKEHYRHAVERALFLAGSWEFNTRGLIYTPLSGNWADEYIQEGYVLSDQLLYMLALHSAGQIFHNSQWQEAAEHLRRLIEVNYWPRAILRESPLIYHSHAYHQQIQRDAITHWLPTLAPNGYTNYFDGLAHALALLTDLGDTEQRKQVKDYTQSLEREIGSALLPAFWPVIHPGDAQWDALNANHLYDLVKNQPYCYHNGGLWPMITGFFVVGLVRHRQKERAHSVLQTLHAANAQGEEGRQWDFAEYHHGQTHQPMGTRQLAWSAAASILAHQAVWHDFAPWPLLP